MPFYHLFEGPFFGGENSHTKIDYEKQMGTLVLTSLLEDLDSNGQGMSTGHTLQFIVGDGGYVRPTEAQLGTPRLDINLHLNDVRTKGSLIKIHTRRNGIPPHCGWTKSCTT